MTTIHPLAVGTWIVGPYDANCLTWPKRVTAFRRTADDAQWMYEVGPFYGPYFADEVMAVRVTEEAERRLKEMGR